LEYLIKTYTKENELVLDCFAGSGSTLVACEEFKQTVHRNRERKRVLRYLLWIDVTEDDRARIDYIKDFESFDSAKKYMETLDREVCSDIVGPLIELNSPI
jgi:hypothetical protein